MRKKTVKRAPCLHERTFDGRRQTGNMIEQKQLLSINYYKKGKPFTGSDRGMRFRIVKEADSEGGEDCFLISVWEEPYCFEATPREEIIDKRVPFTEEEFERIAVYLNEIRESRAWP